MTDVTNPSSTEEARNARLRTLLSYLAADPDNKALKAEAAEHALAAKEPQIAVQILGDDSHKLSDQELHFLGLAHLELKQFEEAASNFRSLLERGVDEPAIRFNLGWTLAMRKDFAGALDELSPAVTQSIAQAAMLEIQLLHELGEFETAAQRARDHIARYPDHAGLAAAVSVLALDIEDPELARTAAEKAGAHPDALATLGTLALGEQQVDAALAHFNEALAINAHVPRAWVGRGLAKLVTSNPKAAAQDIERGAELFNDHIGSWIAAGWAYLIAGDRSAARQRFERALSIDPNFAESHGSLAVIDALDGARAEAQKRIEIALRLDRQCFSAAFAESLLMAAEGKGDEAREIFEKILQTPVNERGDTAAAAISRLGLS